MTASTPRLLLISSELMLPLNSGGRLRTWSFVQALKDRYELNLVHPQSQPVSDEDVRQAKQHFANIWSVEEPPAPSSGPGRFGRLPALTPWEIERNHKPAFASLVDRTIRHQTFDFVLARHIYQAQYVFGLTSAAESTFIVDLDDIETVKIERLQSFQQRGPYATLRTALNNWALERYHRQNLPRVDTLLAVSEADRQYLLEKRWSSDVTVVPNSIDFRRYSVGPLPVGKTLLFCGALNYEPNVDGLQWFMRDVFPRVKAMDPEIRLVIVGRSPLDTVKALAQVPSVSLHTNVADVTPFYDQCSAVITPIRSASGTRIKILEAGACRRPVVSTTIGAEGLAVVSDVHCLIADEPDQFARACVLVVQNPALGRRLGDELYRAMVANYDTAVVARRIQAVFESSGERRRSSLSSRRLANSDPRQKR